MVSYCNSLAMYRHQQQALQQAHPAAPGWYQSYQPHPQHAQQYQAVGAVGGMPSWHHPPPPHTHPAFQPGDWSPSTTPDYMHHHHHHHHQSLHQHDHAEALLPGMPSPPMTVSGSDMSSPSGGGTVTPPSGPGRPLPARSPFEWMKKPSYQSQPNPGKWSEADGYRVPGCGLSARPRARGTRRGCCGCRCSCSSTG
ncbi:hypothetical protein ONE63_006133 [Megalurothrips usitatus]|uniref:Uncharacterized protein n=1 Tax=Megalurothrips usitatus TaxID=439358 RepID=A0AAV7XVU3_9NEOP|nr:hypothetical protein ONE63_006133 [Megalurothrips usitatus]